MNRSEEELMEDIPGTKSIEVATALASEEAAQSTKNQLLYANLTAADMIDSLPLETRLVPCHRQYGGFWQSEFVLKGIAAARTCFQPEPSDIFLSSLAKSGTTWLKALAFATLRRATHSPSDGQHPLNHSSPHDCVGFLELMLIHGAGARGSQQHEALALPSPRLVATHLPYSMLPQVITAESSRCRLVYVCRNPKDVLVSYWNFHLKTMATLAAFDGGRRQEPSSAGPGPATFEEAFDMFCEGRFPGGPHWLHALEYWRESQRRPDKVLFLRYEDMLGDPVGNLRKLAAFMGCAFSAAEEEAGVVDQIVELCSLDSLKGMDVNKKGSTVMGVKNDVFFRKGQVGDWTNYMTPDMAARLDKIVEEATRGSGLTF